MKNQHQVVLSLGSNKGNRLENIKNCLQLLHQDVGTIVKVSKLYETPAWGFESDAFYNCAILMNTFKEADEILAQILAVENKLGRVRVENQGYQSRSIDIDLISYDELILDTSTLQIPHPLMQNRKFVLMPMFDLDLDWTHPILNKTIAELAEISPDQSSCEIVGNLESPLQKIPLKQNKYITIEGNIGVGKTTLATKIAQDFKAKIITERFADNPFLPQFYQDQKRYAFPLEVSFLVDRQKQLVADFGKIDFGKECIIADYDIFKSLIFAKITLEEEEYKLYKTLFDLIHKEISKPDLYVYLYQNPERLLANIKKRGRAYEQNIDVNYLDKINIGYTEYIKSKSDNNIIIIDVSDRDFVKNQSDYIFVLEEIKKGIDKVNTV